MSSSDFVDRICQCVGVERESSRLELKLYFDYGGRPQCSFIQQESDMYTIYHMSSIVSEYVCKIHVKWTLISPNVQ